MILDDWPTWFSRFEWLYFLRDTWSIRHKSHQWSACTGRRDNNRGCGCTGRFGRPIFCVNLKRDDDLDTKYHLRRRSFSKQKYNTVHESSSNTMLDCDVTTHRTESWPPGPALTCWRPRIHTPRSPTPIYWASGVWEKWCGVYFPGKFPPWFSLMSALPVHGTSSRRGPGGTPWRNTSGLSSYPLLEIDVCSP